MPKDGTTSESVAAVAPYPGSQASVAQLLALAEVYQTAADTLFDKARGKGLAAHTPGRLCALHAIELYQNAYLRHRGTPPEKIRAKLHAVDDEAFADALGLRLRTRRHLLEVTERREYLIARYAPDLTEDQSNITRILATVTEVGKKTRRLLGG